MLDSMSKTRTREIDGMGHTGQHCYLNDVHECLHVQEREHLSPILFTSPPPNRQPHPSHHPRTNINQFPTVHSRPSLPHLLLHHNTKIINQMPTQRTLSTNPLNPHLSQSQRKTVISVVTGIPMRLYDLPQSRHGEFVETCELGGYV